MYKAILVALNKTLIPSYQATNARMPDAEDWIQKHEKYNSCLIDWLSKVDSQVYIVTVRKVRYQEVTLDAIEKATFWKPARAYFNDTLYTGREGGKVKSILLDRLLEDTGLKTSELYAFESNTDACRMWKRRGVPGKIVTKCSNLPSDEWFTEASG